MQKNTTQKPAAHVNQVRETIRKKLRQIVRGGSEFRETYLFRDNQFVGIRFQKGFATAEWRTDDTSIQIKRGEQQIMQVDLQRSHWQEQKAA